LPGRAKEKEDVEAGPAAAAAAAPEPKSYADISGGEESNDDGEHVYDV